jgi:hypothetical protein
MGTFIVYLVFLVTLSASININVLDDTDKPQFEKINVK